MRRSRLLVLTVLLTMTSAWGSWPTMAAENECGDATSFDFPDPASPNVVTYDVTACVPAGKCIGGNTIDAGLFFCHEKAESKCSRRKCASELQDCHPTFSNTKESKFALVAAVAAAFPCKPRWTGCKFTLTVNAGDHIRCWCNCGSAIYFPKNFRASPHIN
jgi:hypothetical protein